MRASGYASLNSRLQICNNDIDAGAFPQCNLEVAIQRNDIDEIIKAFQSGAVIINDEEGVEGTLSQAILNKSSYKVIELLINRGAEISNGISEYADFDMTQIVWFFQGCLESIVDAELIMTRKTNSLALAIKSQLPQEVFELLILNGADPLTLPPFLLQKTQMIDLQWQVRQKFFDDLEEKMTVIAEVLLSPKLNKPESSTDKSNTQKVIIGSLDIMIKIASFLAETRQVIVKSEEVEEFLLSVTRKSYKMLESQLQILHNNGHELPNEIEIQDGQFLYYKDGQLMSLSELTSIEFQYLSDQIQEKASLQPENNQGFVKSMQEKQTHDTEICCSLM
ncbi:hypothetical protein OAP83_01725 [Rickettsiales bacterium]|nr:hypothetical protein [Rickettsiales bacterium]